MLSHAAFSTTTTVTLLYLFIYQYSVVNTAIVNKQLRVNLGLFGVEFEGILKEALFDFISSIDRKPYISSRVVFTRCLHHLISTVECFTFWSTSQRMIPCTERQYRTRRRSHNFVSGIRTLKPKNLKKLKTYRSKKL